MNPFEDPKLYNRTPKTDDESKRLSRYGRDRPMPPLPWAEWKAYRQMRRAQAAHLAQRLWAKLYP